MVGPFSKLRSFGSKAEAFAFRHPSCDRRINILAGAVRSSKTWAMMPKLLWLSRYPVAGHRVIVGVTKNTVYNNVLDDLFSIIGPGAYQYNKSSGEVTLFGTKWRVIGARDEGSEKYIRGLTVGVAYCDELTLILINEKMTDKTFPEFQQNLRQVRNELGLLRQNWLISESSLITFARDRGLAIQGVVQGDPGGLHRLGMLEADDLGEHHPRFHPFRFYPLHRILKWRSSFGSLDVQRLVDGRTIIEWANQWNAISSLAILLEPIYWPKITGRRRCKWRPLRRMNALSDPLAIGC